MKERKVPMRTCVGCTESKDKNDLIRIAIYEGEITVDQTGRSKGRGIYICKNSPGCFDKAVKRKAFERALKRPVTDDEKERLKGELEAAK